MASLVGELRGCPVEVGDDTFGDQAVDHVVHALLEQEDLRRFEHGTASAHESPEHSPEDEELGDDVAGREAERFALAGVIADERSELTAAAKAFRPGAVQVTIAQQVNVG